MEPPRAPRALPRLTALRYVQPLREGGSLPAVVETEDGLYVVKFRGAGQGAGALVAELISGRIAEVLGLRVPELALVEVTPEFGLAEPDPEIQDLLRASHGINVGLRYLDGAFNFEAHAARELVNSAYAAEVVWLDALLTNPDRTHRNPNLLIWRREPWLIDHGTALYAHHDWAGTDEARARTRFPLTRNHVLLLAADDLHAADVRLAPRLAPAVLHDVLAGVPDELLLDPAFAAGATSGEAARDRYLHYLEARLRGPREWVDEAVAAQAAVRENPPQRRGPRR